MGSDLDGWFVWFISFILYGWDLIGCGWIQKSTKKGRRLSGIYGVLYFFWPECWSRDVGRGVVVVLCQGWRFRNRK